MTFWETLVISVERHMASSGVPSEIASIHAAMAIQAATEHHQGEQVVIPRIPRALQPMIDCQIAEAVRAYGVAVSAQRAQVHEDTIYRALKRHWRAKKAHK